MGVYFFHLSGVGKVLFDPEGRELQDMCAVRAAALHEARSLIAADALEGTIRLDLSLHVANQTGEIVHRLRLRDAVSIES